MKGKHNNVQKNNAEQMLVERQVFGTNSSHLIFALEFLGKTGNTCQFAVYQHGNMNISISLHTSIKTCNYGLLDFMMNMEEMVFGKACASFIFLGLFGLD